MKVGGAVVEDEAQLTQLLRNFIAIEGPKILVHGGGRRATKIAERLGIETKMIDGRRITDADMLEVVTMVYGGLVNKNVVARLQALGCDAIGLTGADANIILSTKRPLKNDIDYGFVGDVKKADGSKIAHFIDAGLIPVIAPLTHDGQGHMLNTNADTMASETAKGMAAAGYDVTLIYAFEKPGVLRDADDRSSPTSTTQTSRPIKPTAPSAVVCYQKLKTRSPPSMRASSESLSPRPLPSTDSTARLSHSNSKKS